MDILNSSISKFVTSIEFSKAPSSSTLILLHGCCSLLSAVRMKQMMQIGGILDAVGNTHINIVFEQTTMSMEEKPWIEVTF